MSRASRDVQGRRRSTSWALARSRLVSLRVVGALALTAATAACSGAKSGSATDAGDAATGSGGSGTGTGGGVAVGTGGTGGGTGGTTTGTGGATAGAGGARTGTGGATIGTGGATVGTGGATGTGGAIAGTGGNAAAGTGGGGAATAGTGGGGTAGTGGPTSGVWLPARRLSGAIYRVNAVVDGEGNGMVLTAADGQLYRTPFTPDRNDDGAWGPTEAMFACGNCANVRADINAQGIGVIAWDDANFAADPVTYWVSARRRVGGVWETAPTTWREEGYDRLHSAIVAPNGTMHVYYGASISERTAEPTGAWSGPTPPGAIIGSLLVSRSFAAFDAAGNGYLVASVSGTLYGYRYTANPPGWSMYDWYDHGWTQSTAVVAVDAQGRGMVVYTRGGAIGTALSAERDGWALGETILPSRTGQIYSVAMASDGAGFIAVWAQKVDDTFMEVYASRFDGAAWSVPTRISVGSPFGISEPVLEADARGNAVAIWYEGSGLSYDVAAVRYDATARAWAAPVKISSAPAFLTGTPQLAVSANGVAIAAWSDDNGMATVRAMR